MANILYIGKANSLRRRVASYFKPPVQLGLKTAKLVSQINTIEHIEVHSEIEALLLESRLIKKFKPPFNLISKDDKSPYYIHLPRGKFPRPIVNHIPTAAIAGPFLSGFLAKKLLRQFRRITPFCTAQNPSRPCLHSHLGLCAPCPGDLTTQPKDYQKNIRRLKKMLRGHFRSVQAELTRTMHSLASRQDYEQAGVLRDQLRNLQYLLQAPVSPEEYMHNPNLTQDLRQEAIISLGNVLAIAPPRRIELYDVANLSGTTATGAMTVAIDGEINSRWFRHFTIKTKSTPDDVGMLAEILSRRLSHTDWPTPDLIVLDGGKSQLSIVTWSIPTIGLAKQREIIHLITGEELHLPPTHPGLRLLQQLRNEAHRFSRRLHHKHRSKNLVQ